ncbi:SAM-dependent methyltransferase [Demequina sp. TTPB684]|uniref:class I SAM-dependent methyltransferase n=1 Tax=unclassified Demequina TaxID=2620311 RepID=UPI001CF5C0D5|nr:MULTISPECIES: class I SAM-dependent methyltransferase [unclassified Demequina]MCB2412929.1 SAM-dependent methyltransferase [Demequina sp. TTPB684]UPU88443.1 SAM-dependent methyltransferase [Demequina sp. TMPB413]
MDARAARLALSPETLSLLAPLPPYDADHALVLAQQLRDRGADADVVAAALTQSRLRADARAKFGDFAAGMVFTQEGLEQATRLVVAAHHGQRYRAAGVTTVADLTCGLGADAMAFATLGLNVLAFERDEATALLAAHNLRHWDGASVVHADSLETLARGDIGIDAVFADPARRNALGRRHDPRDYSPPLGEVIALRRRWPEVGIKVGPAIAHDDVPQETEAQWVSVDGDVVEAGLWMGALAHHHSHSALVLKAGQAHVLDGAPVPGEPGELGEYLLEPDGAVIRSGLVGPLTESLGARLLDPHLAYLTTDTPAASPFATTFRIVDSLPYSEKRLASALAARGVGHVEIKKRGLDVDPAALRRRLRLKGDSSATVILARIGDARTAFIAQRV